MADDRIRYLLDVDDKGTPKLVKFGNTAAKSSDKATKGFDKAGRAISGAASQVPILGQSMSSFASGPAVGFAAAGTLAVAGLGKLVSSTLETADRIGKLSTRLGVSTESLSVMSQQAQLSGIDLEVVARAMGQLSMRIGRGDKALADYNITATTADEALYQLADRVAATQDPFERAKIATDAFGKSGMDLLPMLQQGSAALRESAAAAPIYSDEMVRMSERINDKMTIMSGRFQAIGLSIAEKILPQMEAWIDGVDRLRQAFGMLSTEEQRTKGRAEIISKYASAMEADAKARKDMPLLGARPKGAALTLGGKTLKQALDEFDAANAPSPITPQKTRPPAGVGSEKAKRRDKNEVDYFAAMGISAENVQFRYNQGRSLAPEQGPQAESVDLLATQPDWYAGIPLTDKAKESLAKQEDDDAKRREDLLTRQAEQTARIYESISGQMTSAFADAYGQIWRDGRDVFESLYDVFTEAFTQQVINSLAALSGNLLLGALTGGGSTAGVGIAGLLGFASGGNPPAGSPVMVGERRAETFIPRSSGRIEPTANGGDTINIVVSNPAEARSTYRQLREDGRRRNTGIR